MLLLMLITLSASLALWLACSPLHSHGMPGVGVPCRCGGGPSSAGKAPHFQAQTHPVPAPNDHHCHGRFPARGSCGSTACAGRTQQGTADAILSFYPRTREEGVDKAL